MKMTDLKPITALGAAEPRVDALGGLTLRERPDLALASLSCRQGQDKPAPFGLTLPDVGKAVAGAEFGAFWSSRDQWMIEGYGLADTDFAARLKAQVADCAVTEQTDGFVCIEIEGAPERLGTFLSKTVNLDPEQLGAGVAVRTGLEHMTVFLIRRTPDRLAVLGMRSAAGSLWHALHVVAKRLAA